jgi:hypothetical protein
MFESDSYVDSDWLLGQCSAEGGYMDLVLGHFDLDKKSVSHVTAINPIKVDQEDARLMTNGDILISNIASVA